MVRQRWGQYPRKDQSETGGQLGCVDAQAFECLLSHKWTFNGRPHRPRSSVPAEQSDFVVRVPAVHTGDAAEGVTFSEQLVYCTSWSVIICCHQSICAKHFNSVVVWCDGSWRLRQSKENQRHRAAGSINDSVCMYPTRTKIICRSFLLPNDLLPFIPVRSQCSKSCGRGLRKRSVFCRSTDPGVKAVVVPDSMCRQHHRPKAQETCVLRRCPKNEKLQWIVTPWGEVRQNLKKLKKCEWAAVKHLSVWVYFYTEWGARLQVQTSLHATLMSVPVYEECKRPLSCKNI